MARTKGLSRARRMVDEGSLGGFTIIEVVLVLAIAGLIFMMVFIALPNLQRAQRDTQRRNALGEMAGQIQQYQANNNGRLPGSNMNGTTSTYTSTEEDTETLDSICSAATSAKDKAAACFIVRYMNTAATDPSTTYNQFVDPDGWTYGLTIEKSFSGDQPDADYNEHMIYMILGASCDGEEVVRSNNSRNYALYYKLEGNSAICSSNS